jgi:hypothetical protein
MRVAGPSLRRPDPDRSAHLDAVTALGVAASSRAAVGRRDLLTAWAVVVVVIDIRVRRVDRVVRGDFHSGDSLLTDRGIGTSPLSTGPPTFVPTTPPIQRPEPVATAVALTVAPASVLV